MIGIVCTVKIHLDFSEVNHVNRKKNFDRMGDNHQPTSDIF